MTILDILFGGAVFSLTVSAIDYCRAAMPAANCDLAVLRAQVVSVPRRC